MLNWITSITKMIFDFLKNLFGWVDEGSRKRRASDIGHEVLSSYINPKKHCCHNNSHNYRDVVEIEENDDDVEICDPTNYTQTYANSRHINYSNNSIKRRIPRDYNFQKNSTYRSKNFGYKTFKMGSIGGKSRLNSRSSTDTQFSTLNKTNQLQEKQKYSQLLKKFMPPRIQIIQATPNLREHPPKPIEVIDIEYYEPSTSSRRNSDVFQTPKSYTPTRWFTPMSRPRDSFSRRDKQSIEEIQIDDDNSSTKSILSEKSRGVLNNIGGYRSSEVPARNTLRDKLSVSEVMKDNFITRITQQHNERMEQRYKEAEELMKKTSVLAKHNRLQREAALEVQLARSMRLCEAVLEEADELEEPSLPELTSEMLQVVQHALIPHPKDEILADSFGLRITRKDINTLSGLNWLNDEVINFYMNLLIHRGSKDKFLNVHAMNTFFYPKLLSGGHSSLKRWTRKIDIFAQDIVVVPVHLGVHWCMSIIDFRDKTIKYYDSMGGQNPKCLSALRKYLEDESLDKKKKTYDTSDWTLESMRDIPQQMNGSDCGVFSCTFAEFICANREITFTQDDMPYFRNKMVYEILNVQIL